MADISKYFDKKREFDKYQPYKHMDMDALKKKLAQVEEEFEQIHGDVYRFLNWADDYLKKYDMYDDYGEIMAQSAYIEDRYVAVASGATNNGWPDPEIFSLGNDTIIFVNTTEDGGIYEHAKVDAKSFLKMAEIYDSLCLLFYINYSNWTPQTDRARFHFGTGMACMSEIGSNLPKHLAEYFNMMADIVREMSLKAPLYL